MKILLRLLAFLIVALSWFIYWASGPNDDIDMVGVAQGEVVEQDRDTLTIMTYNLGYLSGMINNTAAERTPEFFQQNLNSVNEFIDRYQPDIIGFQEVDYFSNRSFFVDQLKEIGDANGLNQLAFSVNWDKSYVPFPYWPPAQQFGSIVSGQAVASNLGILSNERIVLEQPVSDFWLYDLFYIDRLLQICKLIKGNRTFYVMNVHLEAWDKEVRQRQATVVKQYFDRLSKDEPVLLIGDFNAEPNSQTFKTIMSGSNISVAYQLNDREVRATYPSDKPDIKIDYIFYSKNGINAISIVLYDDLLSSSDHLPVLFDFTLN